MSESKEVYENEVEVKGDGKWNLRVRIDDYDDALVFSEKENVPGPNEYFYAYPAYVDVPRKMNKIQVMIKALQYSGKGILTWAYKD